jgi:hypothetical protein
MTWKELAEKINGLTEEQQGTDVTFFDTNDGEYYLIPSFLVAEEDEDRIDPGHPFLQGWG